MGKSQSVIMAEYMIGLLTIYGTKKRKEKSPVRTRFSTGTV